MNGAQQWEDVVRVVFPVGADGRLDDEVLPLYALDWTVPRQSDALLDPRVDLRRLDFRAMNQSSYQKLVRSAMTGGSAQGATTASYSVLSRDSVRVASGGKASFCSYFNAFPGGYWTRWTAVRSVRLVADVVGSGVISVSRSDGRGLYSQVASLSVGNAVTAATGVVADAAGTESMTSEAVPSTARHAAASSALSNVTRVTLTVPLTGMMDGGYVWFDAQASGGGADGLTISHAAWQVPTDVRVAADPGTVSVAVTTFNRPTYCLDQLEAIAADRPLLERLDTVYCIDQGSDLVSDQPGFNAVAARLGRQLTYLRQRNLGGSGGFSRGMYETLQAGRSSSCMLLDDDAVSEPEAILRAVQFADYTVRPVIVGGAMFHLDNRTSLFSSGECFDWKRMWYYPALGLPYNHDFAADPLRDCPRLHQRVDEDYNGWWMCLIPVSVIRRIGLSLPVFIKFDDIEYGLRAKKAGIPTVQLPGVAVWHQAWHEKDQTRTWEEYFAERNRFLAMLLHEPGRPVTRVLFESFFDEANLGLRLQYSSMALRHLAFTDLLAGPQHLVDCLPTKLSEVRELQSRFTDARFKPSLEDFPPARRQAMPPSLRPTTGIERRFAAVKGIAQGLAKGAVSALKSAVSKGADPRNPGNPGSQHTKTGQDIADEQHQLDPCPLDSQERPNVEIAAHNTSWLSFAGVDSALVTSPDGNSVAWLKRDDAQFRSLMRENYHLTRELLKRWKDLSREYREYDLASVDVWEKIFGVKE